MKGKLREVEDRVAEYKSAQRRRLGLDSEPVRQWREPPAAPFLRSQRESTTILLGGLTVAQDHLVQAALRGLGYRIEVLDCPDTDALHIGKEFGNRGQCNPTYFTVGNLVKRLIQMRDQEGIPTQRILEEHVFLTAGACGPCRFGTYVTEYRRALRQAGFEGFRVVLFQQKGGLSQADGQRLGLELNPRFFIQLLKAIVAGDALNAIGYRIRPYERESGATDRALLRCRGTLAEALQGRGSLLAALRRCRRELESIAVDRLQPKPKVTVIGEFWAMTTEGDGNYRLQRFLEEEGAEVEIQLVTSWILYMIWQARHDTRRRMGLRGEGAKGGGRKLLAQLWAAERVLKGFFRACASAIGLQRYPLPDMGEIARLAKEHYHLELRGGEGHMEVGKLVHSVKHQSAHMVVSVKPFGCMPSSSVSDGVQAAVMARFPEAIFCPVETSGDAAANFQSRILMDLFKARRRAKEEFEEALRSRGLTLEQARSRCTARNKSTSHPRHIKAGSAANLILSL